MSFLSSINFSFPGLGGQINDQSSGFPIKTVLAISIPTIIALGSCIACRCSAKHPETPKSRLEISGTSLPTVDGLRGMPDIFEPLSSSFTNDQVLTIANAITDYILRDKALWEFDGSFRLGGRVGWLKDTCNTLEAMARSKDLTNIDHLLKGVDGTDLIALLKRVCRFAKDITILKGSKVTELLTKVCESPKCLLTSETIFAAFPQAKKFFDASRIVKKVHND